MTFEEVRQKALAFRDERDWTQFHNPKDLAISISLEASELLECFQWSGADTAVPEKRGHMSEELADVLIYCIYMSEALGLDPAQIICDKIDANAAKYPVARASGNALKCTQLTDQ